MLLSDAIIGILNSFLPSCYMTADSPKVGWTITEPIWCVLCSTKEEKPTLA